jgi:hypothetical protein
MTLNNKYNDHNDISDVSHLVSHSVILLSVRNGDEELLWSFSFHCVNLNTRDDSSFVSLGISETDISRLKRKERENII